MTCSKHCNFLDFIIIIIIIIIIVIIIIIINFLIKNAIELEIVLFLIERDCFNWNEMFLTQIIFFWLEEFFLIKTKFFLNERNCK